MTSPPFLHDPITGAETLYWKCDSCGRAIETPEDGWLEWLSFGDNPPPYNGPVIRIVHNTPLREHQNCQFDSTSLAGYAADNHLGCFLGYDGLIALLWLHGTYRLPFEALSEIIRRLHVPGYEHARAGFEAAMAEGVFERSTDLDYHSMSSIKATIDFINADE